MGIRMYSRAGKASRAVLFLSMAVGVFLMFLIQERRVALLLFIGVTWAETTFFVVMYGLRSNWRETAGGRALLWWSFSFWTLMTWILIGVVLRSDFPFKDDIREFLYMGFAVGLLNLNLTLLRIQRKYPTEVRWRNPLKRHRITDQG